jgi:hypothetical protein
MQVVTSIRNRQFVESFAEVNTRLMANAASKKQTTERYAHVDTADVLQRVLRIGVEKGFHIDRTTVSTRRSGTLHSVRIRFAALSGGGSPNEGHPEMVIVNSYNGESSLRFYMGFFRLVCSNGLTMPVPGYEDVVTSAKRRHLKGPSMDSFTKNLDERICAVFDGLLTIQSKFSAMASRTITQEQETSIVAQLGLGKAQLSQLEHIRSGSLGRDNEPNLWALYNAINEALRRSSRSVFGNEMRNVNLLSTIEEAAIDAKVA